MSVHAATILAEDRLRHERRGEPERAGDILHDEPEGGDVVRGLQRLSISEIDLVLAMGYFMMRRLDLEPHLFEDTDDRAARIFPEIGRSKIEVRSDVVRGRRRSFVRPRLEHEELGFHSRVHREAGLGGTRDDFLENSTRITGEGLAIRCVDVADKSGDTTLLVAPREYLKRAEVRDEEHIRLFDANKSFDRRAVEHD